MQFLRGLNDQYNNICSHVLLMDPIPPISKQNYLVVQQECQLSAIVPISNLSSLNSNRITHPSNIVCTFCGKSGHSEAICFRKHGFHAVDIKTTKMSYRKLCTFCNHTGHTVDCYKKHSFPPGYKFNNRTPLAHNLVAINVVCSKSLPKEHDIKDIHLTSEQCVSS